MRNKASSYIFRLLFCSFCLISTLVSITQVSAEGEANNTVSTSSSATASVTVSSACSFSRISGNGEYNGTLSNGATTSIPGSTFTTICNDPGGYAIYAVGYSNNTFGNTDLIFNNTPGGSNNIKTDGNSAVGGNGSYWGMSLSSSESGKPSIESGFSDSNNPHIIPSTYTKIASYNTTTAGINTDTSQEELLGQSVTVTYSATASSIQPAGTYTGAVKYTMVHPGTTPAPTITIEDLHYMQDFAGLTNSDKAGILASMPTGVQYQLIDNRDDKSYYISKLADNNIWMTQNLDLCIGCDDVANLTSENTDLNEYGVNSYTTQYGYAKDNNNIITWTPASTAITSDHTIDSDELVSDWVNDSRIPYSVEGGDFYYYTNNLDQQYTPDIIYDSISACTEPGHTEADCTHYHIGNYYNQTAAIASNNSYPLTTKYSVVANSICPAGWRLPKGAAAAEYSAVTHEFNQLFYASDITVSLDSSQYATDGFLNIRKAPLYFVRSGYIYDGKRAALSTGYYNSSTVFNNVYFYSMNFEKRWVNGSQISVRAFGKSVRCLARQKKFEILTLGGIDNTISKNTRNRKRDGKVEVFTPLCQGAGMKKSKIGKIIKPGDANIWPHEEATANTLTMYGYNVEFIRKSNRDREHSADAYVNKVKWEFKAPTAKHTKTILKNLKEAKWQSDKVILDSRRMKGVPNEAILREVKRSIKEVPEINKLKYISKSGKLVDIK